MADRMAGSELDRLARFEKAKLARRRCLIRACALIATFATTAAVARRLLVVWLKLPPGRQEFVDIYRTLSRRFVTWFRGPMYDPVFCVPLQFDNLSWEALLDGLSLPSETPVRAHIRQLFGRPDFDEELRRLFDALLQSRPKSRARTVSAMASSDILSFRDFERFSQGLRGHLHVLLRTRSKVSIVPAKAQEMAWLSEHFPMIFPPDRPLDRDIFPAFAKLIILRRVLRTLVEDVGLEQLQDGMQKPMVVEVTVDLGPGRKGFKLRTITPHSVKSKTSGETLSLISEDEDSEHADEAA
mmetsp:Transcript_50071/g.144217  ORF Transcript_50071/g.144217 Transcript_50071/m.144217 type:complete len:298 (+) Transcript_50071:37-930(+)